ncbi:replication protein A 70 kDa DNA-binding subunit B [Tanacetum coccineum]
MQETVRMALVNQFKDRLEEGSVVTLEQYNLGVIQPKYRIVNKALRLSFMSNTKVEPCTDFNGFLYGFDFKGYKSITSLKQEEEDQFDVIGHVVACEDLDNYDKNGKSSKKKPLTLVDHEGNKLQCTLWSAFAQQFSDFLSTCSDYGKIIMVFQLAMMKMWDDKMCVQNGYHGTKLFVFDGSVPIMKKEFNDVKENSMRTLRCGTGVTSVIMGTIIAIHEEEGWWYIGCKVCKKKVIRSTDMIDLEADVPKKTSSGKDDRWCTKCNIVPNIKTMFHLQIRVQDESGTMSLTLWNDKVQVVVDKSAYRLCNNILSEQQDVFPMDITALVGKKYAFKVSIDEYSSKKMFPVFTMLRLSDDPEIIESIRPSATPTKQDTEATSSAVLTITPLKFPKEEMVYLSCDSVDKTERNATVDQSIFSPEFINGLKFSDVPNHRLALKSPGYHNAALGIITPKSALCPRGIALLGVMIPLVLSHQRRWGGR